VKINGALPNRGANGQYMRLSVEKIWEIFESYDYHPLHELKDVLPYLEEHQQAKVHLELLSYVQPKARADENPNEGRSQQFNPWRNMSTDELIKNLPTANGNTQSGAR